MLFQHGVALGLGGMCRQHGLDFDFRKPCGDLLRCQAGTTQAGKLFTPLPALGVGALGGFAACPHPGGGVLLHHVQQLKGDGIDEAKLRRKLFPLRQHRCAAPWHQARKFRLAKLGQHLGKTVHEHAQIGVDALKAF